MSESSEKTGYYYKGQEFKKNNDNAKHADWYVKDFVVEGDARQVFEKYSGIAPDKVVEHVGNVRDRAFENMPYACIGSCRFLNFSLSQNPHYAEVMERMLAPGSEQQLLDLGCCFGHDLRKLAYDGVPSERLYGIDIDAAFIDLGFDLFLDREKFKGKVLAANLFDEPSKDLTSQLGGGVDIVYAASFFNLFSWEHEVILCTNLVKLLKPGAMILGRQLGCIEPGEYPHLKKDGTTSYWHDPSSWQQLWDAVGDKTNTKWKVEATMDQKDFGDYEKNRWGIPTQRRLVFAVYRLQ